MPDIFDQELAKYDQPKGDIFDQALAKIPQQRPDGMKPFTLPNGSQTVQRPDDGAVYIKEANDPRFKGQEGWHYQDPKTKVWIPAPATTGKSLANIPTSPALSLLGVRTPTLGEAWQNVKQGASGAMDQITGLGQDMVHSVGLSSDEDHKARQAEYAERQKYRDAVANNTQMGGLMQGAVEMIPSAVMMAMAPGMAATRLPGAIGTAARYAYPALQSAAATFMTSPYQGESGSRAENGLVAGVSTPFLQAGVSGAKALPQAIRRLLGTKADREAALVRAQDIRNATKSEAFPEGVEPSLGESIQNPNIQAIENYTEYIPFGGRGKQLKTGNAALQAKVREGAEAAKPALGSIGAGGQISESAERELARRKIAYGQPLEDIRQAVDALPNVAQPKNTIQAFDDAILEQSKLSNNRQVVDALKAQRQEFAEGGYGRTFGDLQMEKQKMMADAMASESAEDPVQRALSLQRKKIASAIDGDMREATIKADPTGNLAKEWKQANANYAKEVHEFNPTRGASWEGYRKEARTLAGRDEFQGKIAPSVLQGDSPDMAKYTRRALDDRGKEAVKAEIWRRIDETANTVAEGGISKSKVFSPNKAASAIDDHANFIKEFMNPIEQEELKGLRNALRDLSRSGQYMEQLGTGKSVVQATALTGAVTAALMNNPGALLGEAGVIGTTMLYSKISGSPGGKEWLLKVAKAKPDSPMLKSLMKQLPRYIATQEDQP